MFEKARYRNSFFCLFVLVKIRQLIAKLIIAGKLYTLFPLVLRVYERVRATRSAYLWAPAPRLHIPLSCTLFAAPILVSEEGSGRGSLTLNLAENLSYAYFGTAFQVVSYDLAHRMWPVQEQSTLLDFVTHSRYEAYL